MKKTIIALITSASLAVCLSTIGFAAETETDWYPTYEQTASAYLDQDGNEVKVTVDLTGGWSVEFAPGAVYLYEGDTDGEATALGITLDEEVFQDYMKTAQESDSYKEYARSFAFTEEDGYTDYFFALSPDAYFMISVRPGEDSEIVRSRISVELSDYIEDSVGE